MNYVVTAPSIEGPWSDAVELNASGFDPSLFHEEDGRSWLLQMLWGHDPTPSHFAGIAAQEFDCEALALIGERHLIFEGSKLGLTEGPHLYKHNGWYHLLTAEGGTGYDHACTWARSKNLLGPYELHPQQQILTTRTSPDYPLQRAGHGDLVETPDGTPYLVHLMSRPLGERRSVMGRETGLQECEWRDDWLWVKGGPLPATEVELNAQPVESAGSIHYDFSDGLPIDFQWPRSPEPDRLFKVEDNNLRLFGRESIGSWHEQSLVARRQTNFTFRAETELDFDPKDSREMAGLTLYYSRNAFYFLAVSCDPKGNRILKIVAALADNRGGTYRYLDDAIILLKNCTVRMAVAVDHENLQFSYAVAEQKFRPIGPVLDATILSDEASVAVGGGCFTGTFVGVCAVDMNGLAKPADFSWFSYAAKT